MIIGATPETDFHILNLAEGLYKKYELKRVFFSAYIPVVEGSNLPSLLTKPPLLREHRLYQADWLLRFYGFKASELLDEEHQSFNPYVDPKCTWALNHPEFFPVEINRADYEALLRVPGIGVKSAKRIIVARRAANLGFEDLKKLGVVMKRAQFFITCRGRSLEGLSLRQEYVMRSLMSVDTAKRLEMPEPEQLSLFSNEEYTKCLTGQI
ncbi:MAG: helix-hairpin-helix domain-containing protein, partial [Oscillospiraceae bacterium]|nr:helix-hairpin-helix domain-containing protein [Oscillospiraceae bacterium]